MEVVKDNRCDTDQNHSGREILHKKLQEEVSIKIVVVSDIYKVIIEHE